MNAKKMYKQQKLHKDSFNASYWREKVRNLAEQADPEYPLEPQSPERIRGKKPQEDRGGKGRLPYKSLKTGKQEPR